MVRREVSSELDAELRGNLRRQPRVGAAGDEHQPLARVTPQLPWRGARLELQGCYRSQKS